MSCQDFSFRLNQSESLPIYNLLRFCKIGTAHQTGFFFSRFLLDSVKSLVDPLSILNEVPASFMLMIFSPRVSYKKKTGKKHEVLFLSVTDSVDLNCLRHRFFRLSL